jgi:hypothetical protein
MVIKAASMLNALPEVLNLKWQGLRRIRVLLEMQMQRLVLISSATF